MIDTPIAQAILDAIQGLSGRFDRMEARFDAVEARLERVETRLERLETRVDGVEARLTALETEMTEVKSTVADLDARFKSWPDMNYLAAAAKSQLVHTREMEADIRDIKIRIGEIYQTVATEPEVTSLRGEVSQFRDDNRKMEIRVGAIEMRLGMQMPSELR